MINPFDPTKNISFGAVHEAAHAVVGAHLHLGLKRVDIFDKPTNIEGRILTGRTRFNTSPVKYWVFKRDGYAVQTVAARAAVDMFSNYTDLERFEGDYIHDEHDLEMLAKTVLCDPSLANGKKIFASGEDWKKMIRTRADKLVLRREIKHTILDVAHALDDLKSLTGKQVHACLKRNMRRIWD